MALYHDFLVEDREFTSYEDLKAHCRLKAPENFNFAYDIVDRYTVTEPGKRALVWCDDDGEEHTWTFEQISADSKRTAYFLASQGIKKRRCRYDDFAPPLRMVVGNDGSS